jgi:2,3-bisphosphoglycerate-dependent phosphoglycerate mutase
MAQVYLFRHGQTTDNLTHTFSGKRDVDLTPQGEEEAKKIGEELKDIIATKAYDSGQLRSRHTLALVLGNKYPTLPIIEDPRIRERDYGELTGLNKDEMAVKHPQEYPLWHRSYDAPPPGGESVKDVEKRVMEFLNEEMPKWQPNDIIFISAHGNSIRPFRKHFEGMSNEEMSSFEHTPGKIYHYQT